MAKQNLSDKPIAVLIDAENVLQSDLMSELLKRLGAYRRVGLMRAYGNMNSIEKWKEVAIEFGIQPMFQFNANGKGNANDFALTIDAMDLLHSGRFSSFCIVSGDSDFRPLVTRLRAEGLPVYGCGDKGKTGASHTFYDDFFYVDDLLNPKPEGKSVETKAAKPKPKVRKPIPSKSFMKIVKSLAGEDGHSPFAEVEAQIKASDTKFSPAKYGYDTVREMFEESDRFVFVPKSGKRKAYVKLR